jgi:hypothetical protein
MQAFGGDAARDGYRDLLPEKVKDHEITGLNRVVGDSAD